MISRAWGVAIIILSLGVILFNTFFFMNSSAHFDYNEGTVSLSKVGLFWPFFISVCTLILGYLLWKEKILSGKS